MILRDNITPLNRGLFSIVFFDCKCLGSEPSTRSGARFSKLPKIYGPFSGVTIPFVSQERRGFKSSNFRVIFLCYLENTLKDRLSKISG